MGGVDFSSIHSSLKSLSVGSLCDGLVRLGFPSILQLVAKV